MRTTTILVIALLGGSATGFGIACGSGDGGATQAQIEDSCHDYCVRGKDCDSSLDVNDCRSRCENTLNDCMADEQGAAADDVESCSQKDTCDHFLGCTVGAGLQCTFGI